jgi:hypothetical protein
LPNFIKRKHPRKGEKKKQRARTKELLCLVRGKRLPSTYLPSPSTRDPRQMHPLMKKKSWDFLHVRRIFFILTKEGENKRKRRILQKKKGYFNFHLKVGGKGITLVKVRS